MKKPARLTPEAAAQLANRDKRRMIAMAIGVVLLGIAYFVAQTKKREYEAQEEADLMAASVEQERVPISVPPFDSVELLDQVRDASPEDRVLVDKEPLDAVMRYVGLLDELHFQELGLRDLTPEVASEIAADPSAHRLDPLRARGIVGRLGKRRSPGANFDEHFGSIVLENGTAAHFVVREVPQNLAVGHFVRVNGLFLKLFSAEAENGFIEGPLVLGRRLVESFEQYDSETIANLPALDDVRDDSTGKELGIPLDARWQLMARAAQPHDDAAELPELTNHMMVELFKDGAAYRGERFRLPVSINMGTWVEAVPENPLRLDKLTTGFIANATWKGAAPLMQFIAPFERLDLQDRQDTAHYLTGTGYFLKNTLYQKRDGQPAIAPFFVMDSIETFTPGEDKITKAIMWGVFGGAGVLVVVIWFLVMRDKRESKALQEEILRRRRERRARSAAQPSQP